MSFCETMELVPKEELETYTEGNSLVDRRARKVSILTVSHHNLRLFYAVVGEQRIVNNWVTEF